MMDDDESLRPVAPRTVAHWSQCKGLLLEALHFKQLQEEIDDINMDIDDAVDCAVAESDSALLRRGGLADWVPRGRSGDAADGGSGRDRLSNSGNGNGSGSDEGGEGS